VNQKYSRKEALLVECPNCRQNSLILKSVYGRKRGLVDMQNLQTDNAGRGTKEETVYYLRKERRNVK